MIENCGIVPTMNVGGNNSNGMGWGGDWSAWIIIFLIFSLGGFGGNRGGMWGNGSGVIGENYALVTDVATLERKLDDVTAGICDSTYALNNTMTNGFAGVQQTLCQGFSGVNTALVQQGYESRLGVQNLSSDLARCCCDIRAGIADTNYNLASQANMLGRSIEKGFCDTNYNMATQNCQTLSAIDKVGDRIIDYLSSTKQKELESENFALKLAASQAQQNNYLISKLGPKCPEPAFIVQPPQQVTFPTNCCGTVNYAAYNGGCGC